MPLLEHDLGDGAALALRDLGTVAECLRLTVANLARLRRWEDWAHGEQSEEVTRAYTRVQLMAFVEGRGLPLVILQDGAVVGSVGARIDGERGIAEVGYWLDATAEGRGLVTRSVLAVADHLRDDRAVRRVEIRTAVHNRRSRAVAERCGFTLEGVLPGGLRVGAERHDVALYSRRA